MLSTDAERAVLAQALATNEPDPLVPIERHYTGRGADVVMAPFLYRSESRFSAGTFGILYVADALETAKAEWGHHRAAFLRASDPPMPVGTSTLIFVHTLSIQTEAAVDVRGNAAGLLLPAQASYPVPQAFGLAQRTDGADGILYTSVRYPTGECFGALWPDVVRDVRASERWMAVLVGKNAFEFGKVV